MGKHQEWICNKPGKTCMGKHIMAHHPDMIAKSDAAAVSWNNVIWLLFGDIIDNGAISPVIQSTNQSRVPSSRPRTDVRPEGKDTRSNTERKVEQKC